MNCWRIQNLLAPYLDGVLPVAEHEAFQAHVESCSACDEIVTNVAALPDFEHIELNPSDRDHVLDALSETISARIAAAAPSITEDGRDLSPRVRDGGLLHFFRQGELRVSGAAAAAYAAAVLLLAAGIGLNHQRVVDLEASIAERDAIIDGMSARIAAAEPDILPFFGSNGPAEAGVVILPAGASGAGALIGSPVRSMRNVRPLGWTQPAATPQPVSLGVPNEGPRVVH